MHILFVDRSGAKSIWELMEHISIACMARGDQVTFVVWDDGCQTYSHHAPLGVEVITIQVPKKIHIWDLIPQHLVFIRKFRELLIRLKPDVVHTNFAVPSIVARWAAAHEDVPCIVSTQHELYNSMHFHYRWGLRLTGRYCSSITYVSNTVARSFGKQVNGEVDVNQYPYHVVIPNGVDIDKIRKAISGVGERISGLIVCAGRMMPVKGQQVLIEALPEVVRRYPHLRLHLVGSGPQEEELRQQVDVLGLSEHVVFLGWLPHEMVLKEMATAELVVVPSDGSQEGFGLVVAEALVCRTPILVSDIPVFHEVLEKFSDRGEFFTVGDAHSLVEKMKIMLSADNNVVMTSNILSDKELNSLSSEAMAEAYLHLYNKLNCMDRK